MEPSLPALESKVLTTGPPGKYPNCWILILALIVLIPNVLSFFLLCSPVVFYWITLRLLGIQLTLEQHRFDCMVPFTSGFFFCSIQPQEPRLANYKFYLDFQPQRVEALQTRVGQKSTVFKLSLVYRETPCTCWVCCFPYGCFPQPFVDDCWFVGLPWWLPHWGIHLQCGRPALDP